MEEWGYYNVPAMVPVFADLRGVTHSADCWYLGAQLYEHNPCSPFGLKYNYPVWLLYLHYIGVGAQSTEALGIVCIGGFLLAVTLVTRPKSLLSAACLLFICTSMPVMLAVERGNCDLIAFILVALFLLMYQRYNTLCYACLYLAAILKIFPVFAYLAIIREKTSRLIWIGVLLFVLTTMYLFFTWSDIVGIRAATPQSPVLSYGIARVGPAFALLSDSHSRSAIIIGALVITLAVMIGTYQIIRKGFTPEVLTEHAIRSFLAGGGIFLGSWICTTNFCYRLIFLLFLFPLFSECLQGHHGQKIIGLSGIMLLLLCLRAEGSPWLTSQGVDELAVLLLAGVVLAVCGLLVIKQLPGKIDLGKRSEPVE
jgi:hypothetical protein